MNGMFQNWFYGEDGMNPVIRIRVLHKISLVFLAIAAYFSFCELKFDSLGMQLFSTCAFFTLFLGFELVVMGMMKLLGPQWSFLIYWGRGGGNVILGFFLALALAAMVGWLVTPLYLPRSVGDPWDVLAVWLGGLALLALWRRLDRPRHRR